MIENKKVGTENYDKKIQEYKKAVEEVKKLDKIKDSKNLEFEKENREVRNKYWDLQMKLDEEKEEEFNIISKKEKKFNEEREEQIKSPYKKMREFKRIIKFIEIYKNQQYDLNIKMYKYDYIRNEDGIGISEDKEKIFIKPISILKDDGYCKMEVFIYLNRKPKNKYTLCVVGKSIFGDKFDKEILKFCSGWNYLSDINENGDFKKVLKELPDKDKLKEWFVKNKDKIFKEQINEIDETIKEYREVIKNTKTKEWEIVYLESRKRYYENSVSNGIETKEYKNILLELKKLLW